MFFSISVAFAGTSTPIVEPNRVGETYDLDVPLYQQVNKYYCGPVCVRMILKHFGMSVTENEAAKLCNAKSPGCSYLKDLTAALNEKLKKTAYYSKGTWNTSFIDNTIASIKANYPVICGVIPRYLPNYPDTNTSDGHFVVVDGYSIQAGAKTTIILRYNDPHYDDRYFGSYSVEYSQMEDAINAHWSYYSSH